MDIEKSAPSAAFRQAQTPKHCNKSGSNSLTNSRPAAPFSPQTYPSSQGPPPPYQRQQSGGPPHGPPMYGMNSSAQTPSRAPGPPGQAGNTYSQTQSSSHNPYYGHPQSVMISPGGNGYANSGRNDYGSHPGATHPGSQASTSQGRWVPSEHERFSSYNMSQFNQPPGSGHGPPTGMPHNYSGNYSNGPRNPSDMQPNRQGRNDGQPPYNMDRPNANGPMQYNGHMMPNGYYPQSYNQGGPGNHPGQSGNAQSAMQQPYRGDQPPPTHNEGSSQQSTDIEITRAVSSSFGESVKSKSSDKENTQVKDASGNVQTEDKKNGPSYADKMSDFQKLKDSTDDASDRSWRHLNQVASLEEEKLEKEEKEKAAAAAVAAAEKNNSTRPPSNSSTLSESSLKENSDTNQKPPTEREFPPLPTPSKLTSLASLSSVASIQEPIDTSNSHDDGSVRNLEFAGAPDLMNCGSSSGSLLFQPHEESLNKRPREDRGDAETSARGGDDEIRGAPSSSPPNVANLTMEEKDQQRPMKKSRSGAKDSRQSLDYDKAPSYTFSLDSVSSFPKDVPKNGTFPMLLNRPGSASSSSLTPLGPLTNNDKRGGGKNDRDGNDGLPSSMPSWEIGGQDSFGGGLTLESAGSGEVGGGPILSSFSFNNEYRADNNIGQQNASLSGLQNQNSSENPSTTKGKENNAYPPQNNINQHPSQFFPGSQQQQTTAGQKGPVLESRNQSFEGVRNQSFESRNQSFDGNFQSRGSGNLSRPDGIDTSFSGTASQFDSFGKPPQHDGPTKNQRPRSPSQANFPSRVPSWGANSHGGLPQNSHSFGRDQPEPHRPNPPHPGGQRGPNGHPGIAPHDPYQISLSGSLGGPTPPGQAGHPVGPPPHRPPYDGRMMRNFSQDSARSSSPGQHFPHRSSSFGGPGGPPHHPATDHHLPHAFRPPPPDFQNHPNMGRRPPPAVYIVSSPPGSGPGIHGRGGGHPNDPNLMGSGPGGVYSWSKEDDVRLTDIMKKYKNPRDWEPIAKEFGRGKTSKECHERWIRYLKPGVRKGQWQDHEDAIVVEAVTTSTEQPFTRWSDLAQRLPGRVGKQIRDRWVNHLNPNINHMPFSREDDLLLWDGHKKLGKRWVEISTKYFQSSRSENHIKNRWYSASFKKFIANEFGPDAYNGGNGNGKGKKSPKKAAQNSEKKIMKEESTL